MGLPSSAGLLYPTSRSRTRSGALMGRYATPSTDKCQHPNCLLTIPLIFLQSVCFWTRVSTTRTETGQGAQTTIQPRSGLAGTRRVPDPTARGDETKAEGEAQKVRAWLGEGLVRCHVVRFQSLTQPTSEVPHEQIHVVS